MTQDLVSIIMPVFNRESLLSESLDSILKQTYQDWECIIVDDHSTDGTVETINTYLKKDTRFKFYTRPPDRAKGANSCRNYGLEKSEGAYIHWFDSDDIAHPNYLEISLMELKRSGLDFCRFERKVFFGDFRKEFPNTGWAYQKEEIDSGAIESIIKNEIEFNTCNILWRRESLDDERFREDIVYADEWEFYSRLLLQGLKGISLNVVLFYGRKHPDSTTFEFGRNDSKRRKSKVKAAKILIKNLKKQNSLNSGLTDYFIKLSFFLKSAELLEHILATSQATIYKKLKYKTGMRFYSLIRPILILKGKILKN